MPYLFLPSWARRYVGKQCPPDPGTWSSCSPQVPVFGMCDPCSLGPLLRTRGQPQSKDMFGLPSMVFKNLRRPEQMIPWTTCPSCSHRHGPAKLSVWESTTCSLGERQMKPIGKGPCAHLTHPARSQERGDELQLVC